MQPPLREGRLHLHKGKASQSCFQHPQAQGRHGQAGWGWGSGAAAGAGLGRAGRMGGHGGHRKLALCPELLGNIVHLFICSETAKRDIHRCSKKILGVLVFAKSLTFFLPPFKK